MICDSCGGEVGRDCFNPEECNWIRIQQENDLAKQLEQIVIQNRKSKARKMED